MFMLDNPLVTIVLPVYNGENYVKCALDSLLSQSYTYFEVLVIDDGSIDTDYLPNLISTLNDSRIIYHRKNNGGVSSAINHAIREMKGQYLAWLSHDDLFSENKLEIQITHMLEAKSDDLILFSGYDLIDDKGRHLSSVDFSKEILLCQRLGGLERGLINGCTIFISKSTLDEVGQFNESLRYTQDYDYWLRCLKVGKNFEYVPQPLVKTRIHSGQDSIAHLQSAKLEAEILWLEISKYWFSKATMELSLNVRETLFFRDFLCKNGFSLAEEFINQSLLNLIREIKVSVVIPYFNRPFLIQTALRSLEGQTHQNLEVVIVDDNSYGEGIRISQIENFSFPIKLIRNENNTGAGQSRNLGLEICTGDFICFLDSDDIFLPEKVFEQVIQMLATDSEISHTNYFSRDNVLGAFNFHDTSRHVGFDQVSYILKNGCTIATPTVMIKRSLIEKVKSPFPQTKKAGEDIAGWITLLHNSINSMLHIQMPLTVVRLHTNSAAKNKHAQEESKEVTAELLLQLDIPDLQKIETIDSKRKKLYAQSNLVLIEFKKKSLQKLLGVFWFMYRNFPQSLRKSLGRLPIVKQVYRKVRIAAGF